MKKTILILMITLFTQSLTAGLTSNTTISYTGVYGNGNLFIVFNDQLDASGCKWVIVHASHPEIKKFQSIALSAKLSGRNVDVSVPDCIDGSTTIRENSNDYLLVR